MRTKFRKLVVSVAAIAVGGLLSTEVTAAQAAPIMLQQPRRIARWPFSTCDPANLQYIFPARTNTRRGVCGGKGVLSGPGWWWRSWPGLVSGGSYYLSVYDAPAPPSSLSKAEFFPTITVPGYYDIWVSWRTTHNRATAAPFWIFPDDGKTYKMWVNQQGTEGFRAVRLGNFFLGRHSKDKAIVRLSNNEGTHSKGIDGIFIRYSGPKNPSGFSATDGEYPDQVVLNWEHQAGATAYQVWRGTTDLVADAVLLDTVPTSETILATTYTDIGLAENQQFNYWLRSVGALKKLARGYVRDAGSTGQTPVVP